MIFDECEKLRLQLVGVAKAESNQKTVEQLIERAKELRELKEIVVAAVTSLRAISTRMAIIGKIDATKAFERVQKLRESLKSDPQSITKGRDMTNMKSAFDKFTEESSKATNATWEQYLQRARPKVDANQVAQAEQQEAFKSHAEQLKRRVKNAEQLSKCPPAAEADFAELESVWQEIRALLESLPAVTDDPKVKEFLKAANSTKGASLDLLTEDVLTWLNDNKTADKYRIVNL